MARTQDWKRGSRDKRRGLTRVEFAVVLGILAVLAAFLAPAVRTTSGPARKMDCLNNARQIGVLMLAFASASGSCLPPLTDDMMLHPQGSSSKRSLAVGWPVLILPAMDNTALLKKIRTNAVSVSGKTDDTTLQVGPDERIYLRGYTCPEDTDSHHIAGGVSYVVNAGFMARRLYHGDLDGLHRLDHLSWDGNDVAGEEKDIEIAAATGVFWRKQESSQSSLDFVGEGDGTTNTLLLVENLQAGNWWDTDTTRIAFGLPVDAVNGRVSIGKGTFFESIEKPLNTKFDGGTLTTSKPKDWRINCDLKAVPGTRPRPSSNHNGGVNVIMCDGAGRFLSD